MPPVRKVYKDHPDPTVPAAALAALELSVVRVTRPATGPSGVASCPNGTCVSLQPATPGVAETGNLDISGTLIANSLQGDGTNLTNVNAAQLNGQAGSYYTNASNISSGNLANRASGPASPCRATRSMESVSSSSLMALVHYRL